MWNIINTKTEEDDTELQRENISSVYDVWWVSQRRAAASLMSLEKLCGFSWALSYSQFIHIPLHKEGERKLSKSVRVILFSNQLKAESLSSWQDLIVRWNHWELQKTFVTRNFHRKQTHKEHLNYSTDSRDAKILCCFSDLCTRKET